RRPPRPALLPYTTLFRSLQRPPRTAPSPPSCTPTAPRTRTGVAISRKKTKAVADLPRRRLVRRLRSDPLHEPPHGARRVGRQSVDRKSTRLNSSHVKISY